ncbi:hypothetical protein Sjap_018461 [Stephania japonica]|uniref:Cation/H+ exchanger domain-containing protein n=1 Tax=Stephania japonica TaxID=461633 RepID=A0AAP0I8T8_9MAGN
MALSKTPYNVTELLNRNALVCFAPAMLTTTGVWQGDDPLDFTVPTFILHVALALSINRILIFLMKPLRQPRVIADILGGILLGPSVLGRYQDLAAKIFPLRSILVLETMANIGLLYFSFLVGVETDIVAIQRTGKRSIMIALGGMVLPFLVGALGSLLFEGDQIEPISGSFILFISITQSVTAFPVLARILAELKLLNSEIGKIAMSSAIVNDVCAWMLLALAVALAKGDTSKWASFGVILASVAFVCLCIFVIRPAIFWVDRQTPEGESFNEVHMSLILVGVMICGFITDAIGTHSIFGAFVYGLIIPNGRLASSIVDKLEDFISGLLLPLFFVTSGLRTNLRTIGGFGHWISIFTVTFLAGTAKVGGTLLISMFYRIPFHESVTLGLLMNAKGLIEMVILNVGKDMKVLSDVAFAIMVMVQVVTTAIITPTVTAFQKRGRHFGAYKRRTIQNSKLEAELRMLACVHTPRNVPTMINLFEAIHPSRKSPICIYALHLVELTGRTSAMLVVQIAGQTQSDNIISAFKNFEQHAGGVSIQPLTVISPYPTMHEDICNLAEDKHVAFIILPFHKQLTVDGAMEVTNPAFRTVNQNVLANAPLLFFGGPDDREALSYARRIVQHPGTILTIIRFVSGQYVFRSSIDLDKTNGQGSLAVITDNERATQLDEELLNDFKSANLNNGRVVYEEKVVNNGEETLAAIRSIRNIHDLYIVGRGQYMNSPLTAGLNDWSECPELGTIGDILASPDFALPVSVLVVQQYLGENTQVDELITPDSPSRQKDIFSILNVHHRTPRQVKLGNSFDNS